MSAILSLLSRINKIPRVSARSGSAEAGTLHLSFGTGFHIDRGKDTA